jgi:D-glycero-alpha-D-manno-heptose 1-phosphate guanylyltransferase
MRQDFEAVILAGGLGTRIRRVVPDRPKVIAEINGRPFLTFLLDQLLAAEIASVTLCVGYKSEQVNAVIGRQYHSLNVSYSEEKVPLGTGGALRLAAESLATEWILVMNGDSFIECDLSEYVRWHFANERSASLVMTKVPDVCRYGSLELDPNQRIIAFREKGQKQMAQVCINAGIYLIPRSVILKQRAGVSFSLEHELIPELLISGLYGYDYAGRFVDIGTEKSFEEAQYFFET